MIVIVLMKMGIEKLVMLEGWLLQRPIEKATLCIKKTIIKNLLMQGGITLGSSGLFSIPAIIAIPSKTVLGVVVLKLKNMGSAFSAAMQLASLTAVLFLALCYGCIFNSCCDG
ncbi:hypothetical protein [Nostoc sp.]|uniref:hypothetical protein n=1 Tax=Nostoc sp. TaxID=1180 RepID=UPI002FFCFCB1